MAKLGLSILVIFVSIITVLSQKIAITEDGKKVILKEDKTWEYIKEQPKDIKFNESGNNITGDNVEGLSRFIAGINKKLEKSEFETKKQYLKRLELIVTTTKFNGKPLKNTILVVYPKFAYNAEKKKFSSFIFGSAIISMRKFELVEWNFVLDGFRELLSTGSLEFEITPDKAKKNKENIAVAIQVVPIGFRNVVLKVIPIKYLTFNRINNEVYKELPQRKRPSFESEICTESYSFNFLLNCSYVNLDKS